MTADIKAAAQADRLTGVQRPLAAVGGASAGPAASARVNGVVAAIAALPAQGVAMGGYARILGELVRHLLTAADEANRYRLTFEGHGLLDAALQVQGVVDWFSEQADAEDSGAADEARARYYVTRAA